MTTAIREEGKKIVTSTKVEASYLIQLGRPPNLHKIRAEQVTTHAWRLTLWQMTEVPTCLGYEVKITDCHFCIVDEEGKITSVRPDRKGGPTQIVKKY